jgi:hypothetical protein
VFRCSGSAREGLCCSSYRALVLAPLEAGAIYQRARVLVPLKSGHEVGLLSRYREFGSAFGEFDSQVDGISKLPADIGKRLRLPGDTGGGPGTIELVAVCQHSQSACVRDAAVQCCNLEYAASGGVPVLAAIDCCVAARNIGRRYSNGTSRTASILEGRVHYTEGKRRTKSAESIEVPLDAVPPSAIAAKRNCWRIVEGNGTYKPNLSRKRAAMPHLTTSHVWRPCRRGANASAPHLDNGCEVFRSGGSNDL